MLDASDLIALRDLGLADAAMSPADGLRSLREEWAERAAMPSVLLDPTLLSDADLRRELRAGHRTEDAFVDHLELAARRALPRYRIVARDNGLVAFEFDPAALGATVPAHRLPPGFRAKAEAARRQAVLHDLAWRGPDGFSLARVAFCRGISRRTLTLWRSQQRDRHDDAQKPPRSMPAAA